MSNKGEQEAWESQAYYEEDAVTRLSISSDMKAQGCNFEEEPWSVGGVICEATHCRCVFLRGCEVTLL